MMSTSNNNNIIMETVGGVKEHNT